MSLIKINLKDSTTIGGSLFNVEIEDWKCALGFCLYKEKVDNTVYVIIDKSLPDKYKQTVFMIIEDTIKSTDYSDYDIQVYIDEDFKITKINE